MFHRQHHAMMCTVAARRSQQGFSLIELMLALVLGLLLIASISSIYLGSSQSYKTQNNVSQVQEGGRFSMLLVVPVVRLAGYLPNPLDQADPSQVFNSRTNKLAIYGFNQTEAASLIKDRYPRLDATAIVADTDLLLVAYEGKNDTAPADVRLKSCLGRDVDASHVAVNIFFISTDGNGVRSLSCYDNISPEADSTHSATASSSVQPLVSGVTDMQVLYGIDTSSGSNLNANQYLTSAQVSAAEAWNKVASVQIELTVDSNAAMEKSQASLNTAAIAAGSGQVRHSFQTVLNIRNRLGS